LSFRKEEKLKIHRNQLPILLDWVSKNGGYKLFDSRIVSSTYFDNDELNMFKDSEEGSVPRKKIRIRSYTKRGHTKECSSLEVKISSVPSRHFNGRSWFITILVRSNPSTGKLIRFSSLLEFMKE